MGNARLEEEAKVEEVFTPVSNVIIMVMNLILATLILLIAIQIDTQISHIQVPTFMPRRLQI